MRRKEKKNSFQPPRSARKKFSRARKKKEEEKKALIPFFCSGQVFFFSFVPPNMSDSTSPIIPPSKSQLKKLAKAYAVAERKAASASAGQAAKQTADVERIARARAIQLVEDVSLPTAKRIELNQAASLIGTRVRVYGWVQTLRAQGSLIFLELRDGSGLVPVLLQTVLAPPCSQNLDAITLHREGATRRDMRNGAANARLLVPARSPFHPHPMGGDT